MRYLIMLLAVLLFWMPTTAQIELPLEVEYLCDNSIRFKSDIDLSHVNVSSVVSWTYHEDFDVVAGEWYQLSFEPFEGEDSIYSVLFSSHYPSGTYIYYLPNKCEEDDDEDDYEEPEYWGFECGGDGFLLPDYAGKEVYIDGIEYYVNEDGSFSWVIPIGMEWSWELYDNLHDGNLIATIISNGVSCTYGIN